MISPFYIKNKFPNKIHVFKTNITTKAEANVIKTLLNSSLKIKNFSIDLEDVDKVLRIEAHQDLKDNEIIKQVTSKGFICEGLD